MSFKYESAAATTLQDGTSAALASAAALLCPTAFDNSVVGALHFWADLELVVTFAVAPTAGKGIEVYLAYAPDGTNYADTDNTTPPYAMLVGVLPVRGVTTVQRLGLRGVPLSPWPLKGYLRNQTDQAISAAWTCKLFPYREQ